MQLIDIQKIFRISYKALYQRMFREFGQVPRFFKEIGQCGNCIAPVVRKATYEGSVRSENDRVFSAKWGRLAHVRLWNCVLVSSLFGVGYC